MNVFEFVYQVSRAYETDEDKDGRSIPGTGRFENNYSIWVISLERGYVICGAGEGKYYYSYPEGGWDLTGSADCYSDDIDTGLDCAKKCDSCYEGEVYFYSTEEAAIKKRDELNGKYKNQPAP